jgi:hypothetical protein
MRLLGMGTQDITLVPIPFELYESLGMRGLLPVGLIVVPGDNLFALLSLPRK